MFERLFELLWDIWEWVTPVFVVKVSEGGVLNTYLPFKTFSKTIGPGLYFKVPGLMHWVTVDTLVDTMQIGPLSLTTPDDVEFVVVAVLEYFVKDPRPMCVEVMDELAALKNSTSGALMRGLMGKKWEDVVKVDEEFARDVLNEVRTKKANKWGFRLNSFDIITLSKMGSYRLLLDYGAGEAKSS